MVSLNTSDKRIADYELIKFKMKLYAEFARLRGDVFESEPEAEPISDTQQQTKTTSSSQNSSKIASVVPINAGPTIEKLIEYWSSQSEKRPKTIMEAHTARKRLFKITGLKYANQLEKKHVIKFKDALIAEGLSAKTVEKNINILKTIFSLAVSNDLIDKNPLVGIKLVKQKGLPKPRVPFSCEDLKKIFSSPVFTKDERPIGGAGEACIWLPYIALYTGMRLEEIGQLLVSDIKCHNDIYYINVGNDEFSTKILKTSSSHRRIPIHPELIRLGLLDYVDQMKQVQSDQLFPKLVENVITNIQQHFQSGLDVIYAEQSVLLISVKLFIVFDTDLKMLAELQKFLRNYTIN